jgi:hypothetical protein
MNSSGMSTAMSEMVSERMVKPICAAPFERGLHGWDAFFDVAHNIFDHNDRIIDHKTSGDCERHERQVIQAVAQQIHHPAGPDQR